MLLVHGTTEKGLKAIMNRQGKDGLAAPWDVSDHDGMTYFHDVNKAMEWMANEEEAELDCVYRCLSQAQLQQAMMAEGGKIYALVVDIPEEFEHSVEDDYSCPNMADSASCIPEDKFDPAWIVRVYESSVNVWAIPFIVSGILGNPMFQSYRLPENLLAVAEAVSKADAYCEDIMEIDYDEQPLSILEDFKENA